MNILCYRGCLLLLSTKKICLQAQIPSNDLLNKEIKKNFFNNLMALASTTMERLSTSYDFTL